MAAPKASAQRVREFRVNAVKVGLTYSCPQDADSNPIPSKEALLEVLQNVSSIPIAKYIIAVEKHESGKLHYHCFLHYEKKIDVTGERAWDAFGVHPNVLKGTPKKYWEDYCAKDKDYISNYYVEKVSKYKAALEASSVTEGLEIIAEHHSRDYLLQRDRIKRNLEEHHLATRTTAPKITHETWSAYGRELRGSIPMIWNRKAIVICGPTNLGKTALAMGLSTQPYLVSHMDQLRTIPFGTTHLVLDDMSFSHLPRSTILHLMDLEHDRTIHARYAAAVLASGLPRIFTTNLTNFLGSENEMNRADDPAIARRIAWFDVNDPLY